MVTFIRRGVLSRLIEAREASVDVVGEPGPDDRVLAALGDLGGTATCRQLAGEVSLGIPRVRAVLNEMIEDGRVQRTGVRASTRYHLPDSEDP